MQKIILLRHGEVDIDTNKNISASQFKEWITKYNNANIKVEFSSKKEVENILNEADILVSSSLKRAVQSMELFDKTAFEVNTVFDEAELPCANWSLLKLKPKSWLIIFRILWFFGYSTNSESYKMFKSRVRRATKRLIDLSKEHKTVILIGHGVINNFIRKELLLAKYDEEKKLKNSNWDYGVFQLEI